MIPSSHLEKILNLDLNDDMARRIDADAIIVNFPARHIVVLEGEKSSYVYLILEGIVRGYYIDEQGNDITKCFYSEGEFFSSEGLRTDKESSFTIECLENCKCMRLSYELIHQLSRQDDGIRVLLRQFKSNEIDKLEARAKSQIIMDAEERYKYFCKQYSHILSRIDLKDIASYIGIRAASLSRIRKNLKNSMLT